MAPNHDNEDSSNQNSGGGLLQNDSVGNSHDGQHSNPQQLKDDLGTAERDRSDQGPVERQFDDTPKSQKGPLATLAERVAENPTVQRAAYHIPTSARPLLGSVAEPVSRVAGAVDSTLTTEEGTRLTSTANEFLFAVAGFTLMLLTLAVTKLESTFNVVPSDGVREATDPMANSGDGFDRGIFGDDIPRHQLYMKKAQALCSRYATLVSGAIGLRKNPSPSQTQSQSSSSITNNNNDFTEHVSKAADRVTGNTDNDKDSNGNNDGSNDTVEKLKETISDNGDSSESRNANNNENSNGCDGNGVTSGNSSKSSGNDKEDDSTGYAQSAVNFATRASNATADYIRSVLPERKNASAADDKSGSNQVESNHNDTKTD